VRVVSPRDVFSKGPSASDLQQRLPRTSWSILPILLQILRTVAGLAGCCDLNHIPTAEGMRCSSNIQRRSEDMENPSLVLAISKLAAAGEQAGLTLEQMIELLDQGLEVETLLELICSRLHAAPLPPTQEVPRYRWVM